MPNDAAAPRPVAAAAVPLPPDGIVADDQTVLEEQERAYQEMLRQPAPWVADSIERLRREQGKPRAAAARVRFPRTWMDHVEIDRSNDDFIKDLIAGRALILVYGPSGDGKTFWTIDIVAHAAAALGYRGRVSREPCLVVYIAAEAGGSIKPRFYAWRAHHKTSGFVPLAIITRGANLLNPVEIEALVIELRAIAEEAALPIAIVVFDTLSRSTPGGDEGAQHMTLAVAAADRIRDEFDAASIFVHHSGKDAGKGSRGHSSLYAAADTVISVVDRVATVEKARNGTSGEQMPFELDIVDLGEDDDGDKITTCIVRHLPPPGTETPVDSKPKRLTADEQIALDALRDELAQAGHKRPGTSVLPSGVVSGFVEAWRVRVYARLGADREARTQDAKRKAFARGLKGLLAKQMIGVWEDFVWLC